MQKLQNSGCNVIGYFQSQVGLGETARHIVHSLKAVDIPNKAINRQVLPIRSALAFPIAPDTRASFSKSIFSIDLNELPLYSLEKGWSFFNNHYNIGNWFWETDIIPESRRLCFDYLDEIWVSSKYMQDCLAKVCSLPIHCYPHPITPLEKISHFPYLEDFLSDDAYVFLFAFDFFSIMERKNPQALVRSFLQAFPNKENVKLIIKTINGNQRPTQMALLKEETMLDPRIQILDEALSFKDRAALMNRCDCYVSLHRSEGLGLTMAEAMSIGKPVIATRYSGNLDFMNEENSLLCDYRLKEVGDGHPPYPVNGKWADVHISDVVKKMQFVVNNPEASQIIAQKGERTILENHTHAKAGNFMKERLDTVGIPPSKKRPYLPLKFKGIAYAKMLKRFLNYGRIG